MERWDAGYASDAVRFARERLQFPVDDVQAQVLDLTQSRGLLNCSRQWGKSTLMAIKATHRAVMFGGQEILVLAPTERQSGELVLKAANFLRRLGIKTRGDKVNSVSLVLPNGSRIAALPNVEKNVRGYTASLLLVDEAAMVPDELYDAVRPMLSVSNGDLWLMSTPRGKRGFFYDEWTNGTEPWLRVTAKATDCPRYRPEFLTAERRRGEAKFRREYLCEFLQEDGAMFDEAQVRQCLSDDARPFRLEDGRFW